MAEKTDANTADLLASLQAIDRAIDDAQSVPSSIEVAGATVGPGQLLHGLRCLYMATRENRSLPTVTLSGVNLPLIADEPFFMEETFTKDSYPEGFEGRNVCQMCRLQSWSWKPAVAS